MRLKGLTLNPIYVAFCVVFVASLLLYLPGLSGPFLYDDFNALRPLGNWGTIDSIEKLSLFLSSGLAGPTGRPVSLFTFVLNSNTWPAKPPAFILTNIIIHIFNGIILFFLIKKIAFPCNDKQRLGAPSVALVVAALWVLHPLHASTVLYIVQRMTLLSASFSLLAIVVYLNARAALLNLQNKKALGLLAGVACLSLLALFSKENSIVLPLQILIVEIYLRALNPHSTRLHRLLIWVVVVPASIIVLAYPLKTLLAHIIDYWATGQEQTYGRNFTMLERFWTQQRVLGDYIVSLVFPKMQTSGVFHDNYPLSRSIFNPITTLLWLTFHLAALFFAFNYRKRLPWLFLGVYWFYGSHVIESTFIMLELKFEHRNYMPSMGIILILANLIFLIKNNVIKNCLIILTPIVYSAFLFMSASLWGKPVQASMVWVAENPNSSRANEHAAHVALIYGEEESRAMVFARRAIELADEATPQLRFILEFCETYNGDPPDWSRLAERIKFEPRDWSLYPVLRELLSAAISKECDLLDLAGYRELLAAYRYNPVYQGNLSILLMDELEVHAALHFGERALAIELERNRQELLLPLSYKMNRALIFASYGELEIAARGLDIGIQVAEQLKNENEFTLKNAREMLELIKKDIPVDAGEKYEE